MSEEEYDYEVEVKDGKVSYRKIPAPKPEPKPAPKPRYTTIGRARYNNYVKKTLAKNQTVVPIEKWMPINYPKGIVKE